MNWCAYAILRTDEAGQLRAGECGKPGTAKYWGWWYCEPHYEAMASPKERSA